jgi:radical SAM superfamily enzyme YgiQ (UPF0313 family)
MGSPYTHVGLGIYPVGYMQFIECAKAVKKFDPQIITIAGNVGCLIDETKHHVDYVFLRNGVETLRNFFGEDVNKPYDVTLSVRDQNTMKGLKWVHLVTKVGCPKDCNFCPTSLYFDRKCTPPLITPKEVFEAVDKIYQRTKEVITITCCEPNFLLYRKWWYELFEEFEGYEIPVGIGGPADMKSVKKFDTDRITNSALHFSFLNIGIESFSEQYSKNIPFDEMKSIINKLRNLGIGTIATFIVGFDHHTRERVMEEIEMLVKLDAHFNVVQNLKAFPGTETWNDLKDAGRLITDIPYDFYNVSGFQSFHHPHFKAGFEDMLPLLYDIYRYLFREIGPEVLNIIELYDNKPIRFPYFVKKAEEFRKYAKLLFPSWKKYLDPTKAQINRYLRKMNRNEYVTISSHT